MAKNKEKWQYKPFSESKYVYEDRGHYEEELAHFIEENRKKLPSDLEVWVKWLGGNGAYAERIQYAEDIWPSRNIRNFKLKSSLKIIKEDKFLGTVLSLDSASKELKQKIKELRNSRMRTRFGYVATPFVAGAALFTIYQTKKFPFLGALPLIPAWIGLRGGFDMIINLIETTDLMLKDTRLIKELRRHANEGKTIVHIHTPIHGKPTLHLSKPEELPTATLKHIRRWLKLDFNIPIEFKRQITEKAPKTRKPKSRAK